MAVGPLLASKHSNNHQQADVTSGSGLCGSQVALHPSHGCKYHRPRAALYQEQEGQLRVIASRKQRVDTCYRWLAALSNFSFKLQYRAGKQNGDADGLSRRPHGNLPDDSSSRKERDRIHQFTKHHLSDPDNIDAVDQEVIHAICERQLVYCANDGDLNNDRSISLVESLAISGDAVPDSFGREEKHGGLPIIPHLSEADLRDKQRADQCIRHVISQIERGEKSPPTLRKELPDVPLLLREWNRLTLRNDILYRTRQKEGTTLYQLVLPEDLRDTVLMSLHDHMGHMGIERTLDLVRARFYWPKMASDIEKKVNTCDRCVRRKALPERAAPLVNIMTTRPLELICMDFLSIEPDRSNTKDVLVITDHFTKYAVAVPTSNQKARTVAKCLWDNFIVHYGIPEKLHSDQGPDFESRLIKELCEVASIQKIRTTPYHPRGNPVERFNRTLLNMLGTLENQDKSHWRDFVKPLVHAYNCTKNEVTGFTPYELMFGRQPRLPVDIAFNLPVREGQHKSHSQYVRDLKSHLEESYRIATRSAAKVAERNKIRFDKRVTPSTLDIGDRVLVRNVSIKWKTQTCRQMGVYCPCGSETGWRPPCLYSQTERSREGPSAHYTETSYSHVGSSLQRRRTNLQKLTQLESLGHARILTMTMKVGQSSDDDCFPVYSFRERPVPEFPVVLFKVSRGFCTGWHIVCITVVFGQGTKLIVTDSSLAPPSISLLPPSSEELESGKATLACVAQLSVGFVDVSWTSSGTPVTAGVFTSAVAQKPDKTFGVSSFLTITPAEWTADRVFTCQVSAGSQVKQSSIRKSDCSE
ncbi:hypothetical protein GJAV_G00035430 [Gymnothorax javanicus]|nr:hypothetical protein GJAV_G00035430 [Gymnothorax javanicus]